MPAGFRDDREATARGYAELLRRGLRRVDAGMLASEADGDRANVVLREARAGRRRVRARRWRRRRATPCALSRASTRRSSSGTARRSTGCRTVSRRRRRRSTRRRSRPSCSRTRSSANAAAVRRRSPCRPTDAAGVDALARTVRAAAAASLLRGASVLRVGALAARLPRRRVDRGRAGAARRDRACGHASTGAERGLRGRGRGPDRQRPRGARRRGWSRPGGARR